MLFLMIFIQIYSIFVFFEDVFFLKCLNASKICRRTTFGDGRWPGHFLKFRLAFIRIQAFRSRPSGLMWPGLMWVKRAESPRLLGRSLLKRRECSAAQCLVEKRAAIWKTSPKTCFSEISSHRFTYMYIYIYI